MEPIRPLEVDRDVPPAGDVPEGSRKERQRYKGSLVLDETFLELPARGTRKRSKFVLIEAWGEFYARSPKKKGDKGKSSEQVATSGGEIVAKYARVPWGTGAMLALIGPSDPELRDTPALVIGMKLAGYSHDTTARAAELIRGIQARGYPADYLAADRGLLPNSRPEHIQSAARAAGYKPVFDYKVTEVGLQESYNGAILVDGEWFCPQMPKRLVTATSTYKAIDEDKRTPADFELWMNQLQQRRAYVLRPNEKLQPGKSLDMVCPAYGPSPTARCPLRPSSTEPKYAGKTAITVVPDTPGKICTCKHTAAFPEAAGLKWRQDLPPFLEEWDKTYGLLRSFIESYNGFVKDESRENAGAPGRRRMRGLAAQTLFVCLMVVAANLRKIEPLLSNRASQRRRSAHGAAEREAECPSGELQPVLPPRAVPRSTSCLAAVLFAPGIDLGLCRARNSTIGPLGPASRPTACRSGAANGEIALG